MASRRTGPQLAGGSGAPEARSSSIDLLHQTLVEQQMLIREIDREIDQLRASLAARVTRLGQQIEGALGCMHESISARSHAEPDNHDGVIVHCLGVFEVAINGVPIESWRPGRSRALFQYLVNHRRSIGRQALNEALWPDPNAAGTSSLKVAVHALRHTLAAADGTQCPVTVLVDDAGYRLEASSLWLDVDQFEHCCRVGRQLDARGSADQARVLYDQAVSVYRGDFLEESWDDWVVFRREGLKDQYLFLLARIAELAAGAGDYHECAVRCQQLLEKDRCREDSYRMLMMCLGRLGLRDRVRRWYELCVLTLRSELDVDPDPETVDVFRRAITGHV